MASNLGGIYLDIKVDAKQALAAIKNLSTKARAGAKEMGAAYRDAAASMRGIARAGKIVLAALTGLFTGATYAAAKYEKQLANVSTMLSGKGMDSMASYKTEVLDLAVALGESTETLSQGLYDILSASVAPTEALGVLEVAAKAAAGGLTDTGVAADAITTIMNAYGMEASEAEAISDKLFATVKRGKTTFAELAPAIGQAASTAANAGLGLDEFGAALATATRNGVRTRIAVTGVNSMMMSFLKPSEAAAEAARELGFELNTQTLKTIGLTGVIDILSGATKEQVAAVIENRRALKVMMPILGDVAGFYKDVGLSANSAGDAQAAYAKQTGTMAFQMQQLKQAAFKLLVGLGDIFKEFIVGNQVITRLIAIFSKLGNMFRALGGNGKTLVLILAAVSLGLATIVAGSAVAAGAIAAFGVAAKLLGITMGALAVKMALVTGGITILLGALAAGGIIWALNGAEQAAADAATGFDTLSTALDSQMDRIDEADKKNKTLKDLVTEYKSLTEAEADAAAEGKATTGIHAKAQLVLREVRNATDELAVSFNTLTGEYEMNAAAVDGVIASNEKLLESEIQTALKMLDAKEAVIGAEAEALKNKRAANTQEIVDKTKLYDSLLKQKKAHEDNMARLAPEWKKAKDSGNDPLAAALMEQIALQGQLMNSSQTHANQIQADIGEELILRDQATKKIAEYNALLASRDKLEAMLAGKTETAADAEAKRNANIRQAQEILRGNYALRKKMAELGIMTEAAPPTALIVAQENVDALTEKLLKMKGTEEELGDVWVQTMRKLGLATNTLTAEQEKLAEANEQAYDDASKTVESYYDDLRSNSDWSTERVIADIERRLTEFEEACDTEGALYKALSDKLVEETTKVTAAIKTSWDKMVEGMQDSAKSSMAGFFETGDVTGMFSQFGKDAAGEFSTYFADNISESLGLNDMLATAGGPIIGGALALMEMGAEGVQEITDNLISTISGLPEMIERLPEAIEAIMEAIPDIITALAEAIPGIVSALIQSVPKIISAVVSAIPEIIKALIQAIPTIITGFVEEIPNIITTFCELIPEVITTLVEMVPEIISAFISAIPDIIQGFIEGIPEIISALAEGIAGIFGGMGDIFGGGGGLLGGLGGIFGGGAGGMMGMFNPLTMFGGIGDMFGLGDVFGGIGNHGTSGQENYEERVRRYNAGEDGDDASGLVQELRQLFFAQDFMDGGAGGTLSDVLDESLEKRQAWYDQNVTALGIYTEAQEKEIKDMLSLYETEAENAAANVRAMMAVATQSMMEGDTNDSLFDNEWVGAFERAFTEAEATGANFRDLYKAELEAQTGALALSAEQLEEQMKDFDASAHKFASQGLDVSKTGAGDEAVALEDGTIMGGDGIPMAPMAPTTFGQEYPELAQVFEELGFSMADMEASGETLADVLDDVSAEEKKRLGLDREQASSMEEVLGKVMGLGNAAVTTEEGFNKMINQSDEFAKEFGAFTFAEYMEELEWYNYIRSVDMADYVTDSSKENKGADLPIFDDFISRPGRGAVGFSPHDTIIGLKRPGELAGRVGASGGGGITIERINIPIYGDINTDAGYEEIEAKLTESVQRALKGVA